MQNRIKLKICLFVLSIGAVAGQGNSVPEQLTLDQARALLSSNPDLLAAQSVVEVQRGRLDAASRRPNPTLQAGSEGLSPQSDGFGRQEFSLTFRQEIETAGKRGKRRRLREAGLEVAEWEYRQRQRELMFTLEVAYYQLVLAQENLDAAHEILERFDAVLGLIEARFREGEASGGELRRARTERYRFFEDVVSGETVLENAQDEVLALLGAEDFSRRVRAVDSFNPQWRPPPAEELRRRALAQRPALAVQRGRLTQARRQIELEKARSVPNLIPFAGYRRDFGADGVVFGIEIPLFVFDRNQGQIAEAEAQRRRQDQLLRSRRLQVLRDVETALNGFQGHLRRADELRDQVLEASRESRDIAEAAYRLGSVSLIDLLDAERAHRQTVLFYNQALYDLQISRARLKLAVGGDLR
ncbi:MAG TPA: TolC family protein [Acidobacteriota bacterium]|nr:TolC family protein [Acidobacteriota bacterium]